MRDDDLLFLDEAEEDEKRHDYDRDYDAPNQALVSSVLALHLLLELLVRVLDVLRGVAQLLVDLFELGPLQLGLVPDVRRQVRDVAHDVRHLVDRRVPIRDVVLHLVRFSLRVDAASKAQG